MKILLDTHMALWMLGDSKRAPSKAVELVSNADNEILVSVASLWEVAIKNHKNPSAMPTSGSLFGQASLSAGYKLLDISKEHVEQLEKLDFSAADGKHGDPFDRMLVAQSKAENSVLLTHDKVLALYNEPLVLIV